MIRVFFFWVAEWVYLLGGCSESVMFIGIFVSRLFGVLDGVYLRLVVRLCKRVGCL